MRPINYFPRRGQPFVINPEGKPKERTPSERAMIHKKACREFEKQQERRILQETTND